MPPQIIDDLDNVWWPRWGWFCAPCVSDNGSFGEKRPAGENKSRRGPLFYQTCGEAIVSDDFGTEMIGCLPRLRRFALALTGAPDTADDLVQETCLRALSRAEQFQQGSRLDSWMFKIAQNVWLDKMRSNTARGQHMTMDDAPVLTDATGESRIESVIEIREVSGAIAKLPSDLQMLVMLVCVDGRSYRETSDMLSMPIGTVMSRLARARRLLHDMLNGIPDQAEANAQ